MSNFYKHKLTGEMIEFPPYKCKICGLGDIEYTGQICNFCGWEDDSTQNHQKDIVGYANPMSFNQYKKFWEENKEKVLANLKNNKFFAIEESERYYEKHFKKQNEEIIKKEEDNF